MKSATLSIVVLLVACTWIEPPPPRSNPRDGIVDRALAQVGRPYRYQGADPAGFDASGLVRYVYQGYGIDLPHSAEGQHAQGAAISADRVLRGDLLFYVLEESAYPELHVGIYIGRSRMVHIVGSGKVQVELIDTPYWQRRLYGAVSYWP